MNTSENVELTSSINHTGRFSKSGIQIHNLSSYLPHLQFTRTQLAEKQQLREEHF